MIRESHAHSPNARIPNPKAMITDNKRLYSSRKPLLVAVTVDVATFPLPIPGVAVVCTVTVTTLPLPTAGVFVAPPVANALVITLAIKLASVVDTAADVGFRNTYVDEPITRPAESRDTGVPDIVIAAAPGSSVVPAIVMPPFASSWICWPPSIGSIGVGDEDGTAYVDDSMTRPSDPSDIEVPEIVRPGAPGNNVVLATMIPPFLLVELAGRLLWRVIERTGGLVLHMWMIL